MSRAAILFAALVALSGTVHARQASVEASDIARQVLQHQPWVAETLACPAAAMPKPETLLGVTKNKCKPGKRGVCLKRCTAGNASACYWLATELQADNAADDAADTLYVRACKLGIMSGCTNRAAGLLHRGSNDSATEKCVAQTFSIACAAADPWACTMYATLLANGKGVLKNEDLALEALAKSCKYGPGDPACSHAVTLKATLLKARSDAGTRN